MLRTITKGEVAMKTILVVVIACLFLATSVLAEPPKGSNGPQSLSYLTSQAQKIKLGYTKEAEVIQLLGQPASVNTKTKMRKGVLEEVKILEYGPEKNLIIRLTDGVVTRVDIP
jgi:hypothetical protein